MKVNVSDIDSLRRYRDEEDVPLEDVLADLRRQRPATEAMRAGTALGKLLQRVQPGDDLADAREGDFVFRFSLQSSFSPARQHEVRAQRAFDIDGEAVTLVGKVDGIEGRVIEETKLTGGTKRTGQFDAEKWCDKYQWRCYLLLFGAKRIEYNVFVGTEVVPRTGPEPAIWRITDHHRLSFYAYPELESDVVRELRSFVEFARIHDLTRADKPPCDHAAGSVERITPSDVPDEPPVMEDVCAGCGESWKTVVEGG